MCRVSWPHQVLPVHATAQVKAIRAHHSDVVIVRVHELLVRPAEAAEKLLVFNECDRARRVCGIVDPANTDQTVCETLTKLRRKCNFCPFCKTLARGCECNLQNASDQQHQIVLALTRATSALAQSSCLC